MNSNKKESKTLNFGNAVPWSFHLWDDCGNWIRPWGESMKNWNRYIDLNGHSVSYKLVGFREMAIITFNRLRYALTGKRNYHSRCEKVRGGSYPDFQRPNNPAIYNRMVAEMERRKAAKK